MNSVAPHEAVTSTIFCWIMERLDGAGLALTSGDHLMTRGHVPFHPSSSFMPSALIKGAPGEAPGEVNGALAGDALTETDLLAGRWDGARIRVNAVQWAAPEREAVPLIEGSLGEVSLSGDEFAAEVLGAAAELGAPVCPHTSPECRASFGDKNCRVDLAGRRARLLVEGGDGHRITVRGEVSERFRMGTARWLRGANSGAKTTILQAEGHELVIRDLPASPITAGDVLMVTEGCDKRLATCAERFDNAVNFRGEPYLPGNDLLTRYPGN